MNYTQAVMVVLLRYMETAWITLLSRTTAVVELQRLPFIPNMLVALRKGMRELCTNKILQFLTGDAG